MIGLSAELTRMQFVPQHAVRDARQGIATLLYLCKGAPTAGLHRKRTVLLILALGLLALLLKDTARANTNHYKLTYKVLTSTPPTCDTPAGSSRAAGETEANRTLG